MPIAPASAPIVFQPGLEVGATRIIEDKGIYVLTDAEMGAWRLRVLLDVIVEPPTNYKSYKPNEPECFFGYFELVEGGFVIEQYPIKYLHQQIFRYQNDPAKTQFDVKLAARYVIVDLFNATAAVLNSIPASASLTMTDDIPGQHLQCPVTDIWIRTVPGCKVAIHTEYLPLPKINGVPASTTSPQSLPSPSAPNPENPGGNGSPPADAPPTAPPSPPYKPDTQDEGRTTPRGNPNQTGQWYAVYAGYNAGCAGTYPTREYAIPGATTSGNAPTQSNRRNGSCGESSYSIDVYFNGVFLYSANDITSQTFVFRP